MECNKQSHSIYLAINYPSLKYSKIPLVGTLDFVQCKLFLKIYVKFCLTYLMRAVIRLPLFFPLMITHLTSLVSITRVTCWQKNHSTRSEKVCKMPMNPNLRISNVHTYLGVIYTNLVPLCEIKGHIISRKA